MNVRPRSQAVRLGAALVCASTALAIFLAPPAMADDPLGQTVGQAEGTIDETVDDATDAAGDAVETVTGVAGSAAGLNEVAATAGDAVDDATGSASGDEGGATGQTNGDLGATDGSAGSGSGPSGGGDRRDGGHDGSTAVNDRTREDAFGIREWVWEPADRLGSTWANVPLRARAGQVVAADEKDPCRNDPWLVCLGVLYGIGPYAEFFSSVLGVMATTGMGVLGLMMLALALGTSGSAALIVARKRAVAATGRP
jgi:hypothetical protein